MDLKYSKEFYPEPFPEDLPTVSLERISLAKLLDDDQEEAERLFKICTHEGFLLYQLDGPPKRVKTLRRCSHGSQIGSGHLQKHLDGGEILIQNTRCRSRTPRHRASLVPPVVLPFI